MFLFSEMPLLLFVDIELKRGLTSADFISKEPFFLELLSTKILFPLLVKCILTLNASGEG